jgi:hypothetical protein
VSFVANQSNNHAVEVEEEHQEAEAEFDERFLLNGWVSYHYVPERMAQELGTNLLVHIQLAEDLSRIQEVLVVIDPGK